MGSKSKAEKNDVSEHRNIECLMKYTLLIHVFVAFILEHIGQKNLMSEFKKNMVFSNRFTAEVRVQLPFKNCLKHTAKGNIDKEIKWHFHFYT